MLSKIKRKCALKPLLVLLIFCILCFVFYVALQDALHKHRDDPIVSKTNIATLSPMEQELQIRFERSMKWSELTMEQKMTTLLENPVYERFKIVKPPKRKKVTVLLIVSSGPRRSDRREAIRQTWWSQCKTTLGITIDCIFFTDQQKPKDKYYEALKEENDRYGDMYFQPLRGGIEFGVRFLYHMVWAMTHYEFDYFVRVDDDYFFCLERFLYELPQPMQKRFHWGFTHCILEIVRPEESLILLSRDLVQYYLSQKPHIMRCHPWADQMLGVWTTDLNENELFRNDLRIHHAPIVDQSPELRNMKNLCSGDSYIAIHGTYPQDMKLFWKKRALSNKNVNFTKTKDDMRGNLITNSEVCELVHNFNYLIFEPEWQYEPQRCIYDPVWDTGKQAVIGGVYSGRQDDKRLSLQDLKRKNKNRIE